MISVFEHFSEKNGALRWNLFIEKQKYNVQWPNSYTSCRSSDSESHRCRHVTMHHSLQSKILHNILVVKIYIYIISNANTLGEFSMLETSELVCLNTLYIACAILCSKISRFFKQPSTHELKGNRKQSHVKASLESIGECVFIIWNSLYIATLLCVLWKFMYQSQFANINYLCSWFVLFQLVFYCLFLLSYVAFMDGICRFINDIFFPVINSLSWIICIVCLSQENGYVEFQDIGYFAVHILPVVAASFFEIWTYTPRGTNKLRTVWTMYCPGLFLTLYAVNNDQVEVYKYLIMPPNPWFVAVIGIFSNMRLVFFPLTR